MLHTSSEKAKNTRRIADIEGKIFRMVADNLTNLANTKGSFLKMAGREIADLADEKIKALKPILLFVESYFI